MEITTDKVVKLFAKCIAEYTAIKIENATFDNDPFPGSKKSCEIDYTFNGLRRQRSQDEQRTMNFEWEITEIKYSRDHQMWDNSVYKDKPDDVTWLYRWLDQDGTFTTKNDNLGGDPAPGVHKKAEITYTRVRWGGADYWQNRGGYDRHYISESEGTETAFKEHLGFKDKTIMTLTDPWEWAKKGIGKAAGAPSGSGGGNVISWLVNSFKRDFVD